MGKIAREKLVTNISQLDQCTSSTSVEITDVVKLMIKDRILLENWTQFSDHLGLQLQDRVQWQRGINNATLKHYDVFWEMLNNWIFSSSSGSLPSTNGHKKTVRDLCLVLRRVNCLKLAEKLQTDFEEHALISSTVQEDLNRFIKTEQHLQLKWPLTHGLLEPAKNFSGRRDELKTLNSYFYTSKDKKTNVVLVCGIGGIGKTELCKKFAKSIHYTKLFGIKFRKLNSIGRIWLHGDTFDTLRISVLKLAKELGVTNTGNPLPSEYFEHLTFIMLKKCGRLLVFIDNVDVKHDELTKIIKTVQMSKFEGRIFVIVTSRNSMVLDGAGYTKKLDVLSKHQARKMLKSSIEFLPKYDTDDLAALVQYFPLALQQAVAYIKQQRTHFLTPDYNVSNYITEFEQKKSEMLGLRLNDFEHDYSMTTLVTWDMTISKVTKGAVGILKILAFLEPDGIQLQFLQRICQNCDSNFDSDDLNLLHNYSLVKIENQLVSVHRLVQEVMRGKEANQKEYCRELFGNVFMACGKIGNGKGPLKSELVQLNTVCKYAWNCGLGYNILRFYDTLLFLRKQDGIECALECIRLNFLQAHSLTHLPYYCTHTQRYTGAGF